MKKTGVIGLFFPFSAMPLWCFDGAGMADAGAGIVFILLTLLLLRIFGAI